MGCLYILDINLLSVILLAHILSHSVDCLFILLMVSFVVQKLLSLIRSHLFISCFCFLYLRRQIQKNIATVSVKECLPIFSSRGFMVFSLTLRFLIHFEFIL